jgi:hypothetical protein
VVLLRIGVDKMSEHFTRPNIEKVIGKLGTTPEQRGLSTQEFKDKFDEMPEAIQQYIKETLLIELDAFKQEFMTHQAESATHENLGHVKLPEDWITPNLINDWVQYGDIWETAAYYKDDFGIVHIKGMVKDGTLGSPAFVLPSGYRPSKSTFIAAVYFDGTSYGVGRIEIQSNGNVIPRTASNRLVSFGYTSFRAGL